MLDETASEAQFSCVNVLESCAVTVRKQISRALMSFSTPEFILFLRPFAPSLATISAMPIPQYHGVSEDARDEARVVCPCVVVRVCAPAVRCCILRCLIVFDSCVAKVVQCPPPTQVGQGCILRDADNESRWPNPGRTPEATAELASSRGPACSPRAWCILRRRHKPPRWAHRNRRDSSGCG